MTTHTSNHTSIVRTSRGLSLAGTRITLYSIMDYVHAGWTPKLIRDRLNLTDKQISDALDYIAEHQSDVESEYHQVLREAEENRKFWEEQNRERFARIAALPPKPEHAAIRAKLAAAKAKRASPFQVQGLDFPLVTGIQYF